MNSGELSFESVTVTLTRAKELRGGSPLSVALTTNSYRAPCSLFRLSSTTSSPVSESSENLSVSPVSMEYCMAALDPLSASIAEMLSSGVLGALFSTTDTS